jgi:hypothetical protein
MEADRSGVYLMNHRAGEGWTKHCDGEGWK